MSEIKTHNKIKMKQIHSYEGLQNEMLYPTDIDLAFDINDGKAFVFGEGKTIGSKMTTGQRRHFEALMRRIKAPVMVVVYEHNTPENKEVIVKDCNVRVYAISDGRSFEWRKPKEVRNFQSIWNWFIDKVEGNPWLEIANNCSKGI